MREHIHWLNLLNTISYVKSLQVACLSGRVAANVYYALWMSTEDGLYNIRVHTGTWWVGYDDVWTAVLGDKLVVKDVLHIACIEQGVVYVVHLRVYLGILDSLRHILDAHYLTRLASHKVGYGSGSGIEVVHHTITHSTERLPRQS